MAAIELDPKRDALLLDLDGTLVDIASTPDAVRTPPGLVDDLTRVRRRLGGALAVVSGRPISVIDDLLRPFRAVAAGIHGAEIRAAENGPVKRLHVARPSDEVHRRLSALGRLPGVVVEDKGPAVAVHFRRNPAAGAEIVEAIRAILRDHPAEGLSALPGKAVIEVKPVSVNKGAAVTAIMENAPFAGRRPIYIGDDVTDEAAFAVVSRAAGRGYAVGEPRLGAARVFADPSQVRAWLHDLPKSIGTAA